MMTYTMTCVGYWYFCIALLTLWFLSINKWKQQKQMFVVEVFRTKMKNFEPFTGQWRLLSAWRVMLELHLSLRTGSLRRWNDLRISFRETGTHAVHMIFRQNFVVAGHWFSPKKSWYCGSELPLSFRHRLDAVVAAAGGHMDTNL